MYKINAIFIHKTYIERAYMEVATTYMGSYNIYGSSYNIYGSSYNIYGSSYNIYGSSYNNKSKALNRNAVNKLKSWSYTSCGNKSEISINQSVNQSITILFPFNSMYAHTHSRTHARMRARAHARNQAQAHAGVNKNDASTPARPVDWCNHHHQAATSSTGDAAYQKINDPFQHVPNT